MEAEQPTAPRPSAGERREAYLAIISGRRTGPAASLARAGLALLAALYRLGLAVASLRWRLPGSVRRAPCPVISVGNLTTGGTGKTPMAALLARRLVQAGRRPVLLSRGYGGSPGRPNEEALELEALCPGVPHLQDPDRRRALVAWAASHPCDAAILDDGFQHRRLARNLDIVLVDALAPFGYGHLLPRGLLREPPTALRRADLVVITRAELAGAGAVARLKQALGRHTRPGTAVLVAEHHPVGLAMLDGSRRDTAWLRGRAVAAACGLGHPEAFRQTLTWAGARIVLFQPFPDHHAYSRDDLARLLAAARAAGAKTLVTTGKDAVKWRPLIAGGDVGSPAAEEGPASAPLEVATLQVALRIVEGESDLVERLEALLRGGPGRERL